MGNRGILACAGAGKTYTICSDALSSEGRSLLITYTNKGRTSIEKQTLELNNEVPTDKVNVETWFGFLLKEIIRPYQSIYFKALKSGSPVVINYFQSIDFSTTYGRFNKYKKGTFQYFWSKGRMLRHNETVVLANVLFELAGDKIIRRLEQQYSTIFFDEVQDLTGTDMDILRHLIDSRIDVVMVGDPKQFTYRTHEEHKKNSAISGVNIDKFFKILEQKGKLQVQYKQVTRRFGSALADFANSVDPSGELLAGSGEVSQSEHEGVFILPWEYLAEYHHAYSPTYLVYDSKQAKKLPNFCSEVINYGDSKGITREDIVILPNGQFDKFLLGKPLTAPTKYYIASTRARHSIAFIVKNSDKYSSIHSDWPVWKPRS